MEAYTKPHQHRGAICSRAGSLRPRPFEASVYRGERCIHGNGLVDSADGEVRPGSTRSKKFIYIIQDFEPGLYMWSTEYALALETYGMNYCAIVNSQLLTDYFLENRVGRFADKSFRENYEVLPTAIETSKFHFAEKPRPAESDAWFSTGAQPRREEISLNWALPRSHRRPSSGSSSRRIGSSVSWASRLEM